MRAVSLIASIKGGGRAVLEVLDVLADQDGNDGPRPGHLGQARQVSGQMPRRQSRPSQERR